MSLSGRLFAAGYDRFMEASEKAGLRDLRAALLARAQGRVLEIGGGTGANLGFYTRGLDEIVITEPEEPMARRLERKLDGNPLRARVVRAPAEELPFNDDSFDSVVSTLVLCTVDDPSRALAEVRRVLKRDGRLLFIEHVRADDSRLAKWQDRFERPWSWFGHGCHCNRRTLENLQAAGFSVTELKRDKLPKAPPIVRPLITGVAVRSYCGGELGMRHTGRDRGA